jgi:branched-chain amino acid transport system permease protein
MNYVSSIILVLLDSLLFANILVLVSLGINAIYGIMKILNIAHGAFITLGAYIAAITISALYPFFGLTIIVVAVGFCIVLGIVLSYVLHWSVFSRIKNRLDYQQLIITFGLLLALEEIVVIVWGSSPIQAGDILTRSGSVNIYGLDYPLYNVLVIAVGTVSSVVVWLVVHRLKFGKIVRAVAFNYELASAMGIDIERTLASTLTFSMLLAFLAGALIAPITSAIPGMGVDMLLFSFAVIVIGGLGSIKGAYVGSFIVAVTRSLTVAFLPRLELVVIYLVVIVLLIVKPKGLVPPVW